MAHIKNHSHCQELEIISKIIDINPTTCDQILQDLNTGKVIAQSAGAKVMSADQVPRCMIIKTLFDLSYEELVLLGKIAELIN